MKKIALLIDTSSTSWVEEISGRDIFLLPLHVTMGVEGDFLDTPETFKKHNILERMSNGETFQTSQPSPGEIEKMYDNILTKYEHIIYIPMPDNLSSTLKTAKMVANDEKYEGKITIYQNLKIAAQAVRELILRLNDVIDQNENITIEELVAMIDDFKNNAYIALIPGDLKRFKSSGRAKSILASTLALLKIKILIQWDADPIKVAMSRTYNALADKLIQDLKRIVKNKIDEYKLIILYTEYAPKKAVDYFKEVLNKNNINWIHEKIPNIYTVHAGVDTFGFLLIKK